MVFRKIVSLVFLMLALTAWGQNELLFNKATDAYNNGDFKTSIDNYLTIIENGEHSANLYFNLGNAYYKLNETASSIYYYEKALLLSPNDSEIKNNLGYAQNMTLDAIEPIPETSFSKVYNDIILFMNFDQWAYTGIVCILLFVLLYLSFYFLKYALHKRIAFISSLVILVAGLASLLFAFLQYDDFNADQPAIVFDREVAVTSEPNERSQAIFKLHEGTKVNVLEDLKEYKKIQIADGQTGWLTSQSIKLLKNF